MTHWNPKHEKEISNYLYSSLTQIKNISILGDNKNKIGIYSFNIEDIHSHDVSSIFNNYGISIRTGHHCAMPLMDFFKISSCASVSISIYNDKKDIDEFINILDNVKKIFSKK